MARVLSVLVLGAVSVMAGGCDAREQWDQDTKIYCSLVTTAATVNSQIELYRIQNGQYVWPSGSQSWSVLLDDKYLMREPVNPFSPAAVASRVVVIEEPGATGDSVSPETAGWVWNAADNRLYAAEDFPKVLAIRARRESWGFCMGD